jgi:hypothetical protein
MSRSVDLSRSQEHVPRKMRRTVLSRWIFAWVPESVSRCFLGRILPVLKDAETHLVWARRIGALRNRKNKLPTFRAQAAAEVEIRFGRYCKDCGSAWQSYGKKVHKCCGRV